jgi:cell division protein FtsQ
MISPVRQFWSSPGLMDRVAGMLAGISVLALLALLLFWVSQRPAFAVKRVMVDSIDGDLRHVTPSQIQAAVGETLNGTVLSADLIPIQQSLQAIPWVRSATVRRVWPNRLLVRIEEQRAVAQWSPGQLVNLHGEVFAGAREDHDESCTLALLSGPVGSEKLVLSRARELQDWIAPLGMGISALKLTEQYAWTAVLTKGLTLELGRDTLATGTKERVQMFVQTQPWLSQRMALENGPAIVHADLRYAAGYAFRTSKDRPAALQSQDICNLGKGTL